MFKIHSKTIFKSAHGTIRPQSRERIQTISIKFIQYHTFADLEQSHIAMIRKHTHTISLVIITLPTPRLIELQYTPILIVN